MFDMKSYPMFVKQVDTDKVILEVEDLDPLTVANFPYLDSRMKYITVTRGKNHTLTVVNKDATTGVSFSWGDGGYTLVSDNLKTMRSHIVDFLAYWGIPMDVCVVADVTYSKIFWNPNLRVWQARVQFGNDEKNSQQNVFIKDASSPEDVCRYLERTYGATLQKNLVQSRAQTGIPVWEVWVR